MIKSIINTILPLLVLQLIFMLVGCASEEIAVDIDPPVVVEITPRSNDDAILETGIDAVPDGDYIYISWLPSLANDLAGYRIYRMEDVVDADRTMIEEVEANATEYEDRDSVLAPDQATGHSSGFKYWVTAFDESGNESSLSEEAYYKLLLKPDLIGYEVGTDSLLLNWSYDLTSGADVYFVIRLFEGAESVPFWTKAYNLFSPLQVAYPGTLNPGQYVYKVDVVGVTPEEMPSGSEASHQFSIP